jgi:glycosyltransferase involved in cell wall biosynthesis
MFQPLEQTRHIRLPMKLSIIMPVYNEESTVLSAIAAVLSVEYPCDIELIVVDDGSTDGTWARLSQVYDKRIRVQRHEKNLGKGAALLSAAAVATGSHLLPFDADLEYDPEDIPRLIKPVLSGRCTVVYGARLFGYNTVYRSYRYAVGNRTLTLAANILFDAHISDLHTCMKLMPVVVLKDPELRERGFGLDTEITALLLKQGIRPFEVPISYYGRSHAEGKKITWRDAVICLRILLRVRVLPVRVRFRLDQQPAKGSDESIASSDGATPEPEVRQVMHA